MSINGHAVSRLLGIGCCLIVAVAVGASGSVAAEPPPQFLVQFGETGSGAGQTVNPRGVAANPTNGHVYVAEVGNQRISEFTSWGKFVKAWGWGVDTGAAVLQVCTEASTCQVGISGGGAGQLTNPLGLAVDGSGDIYVVDLTDNRVEKFDPAGNFILTFGGNVNKTKVEEASSTQAEKNLCTAGSGDVCQAGTTGGGSGEFGAWAIGSFIGVGAGGTVYVGDDNRIEKFTSAGVFEGEIPLPGEGPIQSLALNPSGDIYITSQNSPNTVHLLDPSGTVLQTLEGEGIGTPTALSTDAAGNLYVVDSSGIGPVIHKLSQAGTLLATWGEGEFTGSTGIGTNPDGDVYVTNFTPTDSYVRAYGPEPSFEPPPAVPPTLGEEHAEAVSTTTATLAASIDPHFWTTEYRVQYGLADCASNPCAEAPSPPGILPGTTRGADTVPVQLSGLVPGATYHYRFVAESSGGGPVFGPDRVFTTFAAAVSGLPDGRGYELVSPPFKDGGEVAVPAKAGGGAEFSVQPQQASPDGSAITYASFTAFGQDPQSAPAASQYISKRGTEGWSTRNLDPPFEEGYTRDPLVGFTSDLARAALIVIEPALAGAAEGFPDIYRGETADGALTAITTSAPQISVPKSEYCLSYGGASANADRMFFAAKGALLVGDPVGNGFNLYEWSPTGGLGLVSVLPDGTAAEPQISTGFGAESGETHCNMATANLRHAVSADGSRVFWSYAGFYVDGSGPVIQPLMARIDGNQTVQLDARQGGSAFFSGQGRYQDASADGSKVFFTDPLGLTADSGASGGPADLYRYDFDAPAGARLSDLTPLSGEGAGVQGVVASSADASHVYFAAKGVLAAGATADANNLYVWHEGEGVRFITTLATEDQADWAQDPSRQTARVTPSGGNLTFLSQNSLTGYDNLVAGSSGCELAESGFVGSPRCAEVFDYRFASDTLSCISCNPASARPSGPSAVPTWSAPYEQPRYIDDSGGRVFFTSFDSLVPRDINGKQDVYEWEAPGAGSCVASSPSFHRANHGCLTLLSTGVSSDASYFLDASANGDDAFISTRQRLVTRDEDERFDVYDVHVGGGEPNGGSSSACQGEACRPSVGAPAGPAVPGTTSFAGGGNLKPSHGRRRCGRTSRRARAAASPRRSRCRAHRKRRRGHPRTAGNSGGSAR